MREWDKEKRRDGDWKNIGGEIKFKEHRELEKYQTLIWENISTHLV